MLLPIDWSKESEIRALFSWQTRAGLAPAFGSRPIGWYQQDQCEVYDSLKALAERVNADSHWPAAEHTRVRVTRDGKILMRPDISARRIGWTWISNVQTFPRVMVL